MGDQLVDHYVAVARANGASWSQIGEALGVSKQAAQQRRAGTQFERFTARARNVVVLVVNPSVPANTVVRLPTGASVPAENQP